MRQENEPSESLIAKENAIGKFKSPILRLAGIISFNFRRSVFMVAEDFNGQR